MSFKDPTARLARLAIYLQEYEFEIIHRKGSAHTNVDTLSRPVLMVTTRSGNRNSIPVKAITENLDKQLQVPRWMLIPIFRQRVWTCMSPSVTFMERMTWMMK